MDFISQPWFWTGIFGIVGLIIGSLISVIRELIAKNTNLKIEKLKIYDSAIFRAYNDLYSFVSTAYSYYWPPENPRVDFLNLMKKHFYPDIKKNFLYYDSDIRDSLKNLEAQFHSLRDDDLIPPVSHKEFFDEYYLKVLNKLENKIEAKYANHLKL